MTQEISKTIDMLAEKFGTQGARLYEVMIAYTRLDAWVGIIFGIMLLAVSGICIKKFGIKNRDGDYSLTIFLYGLMILLGLCFVFSNITGVVLPEAVMIKYLITN